MHPVAALLDDLHRSLRRLSVDLAGDRPDLAAALAVAARHLPRPEEVAGAARPAERRRRTQAPPRAEPRA